MHVNPFLFASSSSAECGAGLLNPMWLSLIRPRHAFEKPRPIDSLVLVIVRDKASKRLGSKRVFGIRRFFEIQLIGVHAAGRVTPA